MLHVNMQNPISSRRFGLEAAVFFLASGAVFVGKEGHVYGGGDGRGAIGDVPKGTDCQHE